MTTPPGRAIELGADAPAPAVVLLESELADREHRVGRWVRTYAGALATALRGASPQTGVRT